MDAFHHSLFDTTPEASKSDQLDILFHDEYLVAINKPEGLLVHRSWIDRHETRFALQLLRDQIGQKVYPVHRLDKPTSGVLLFALDSVTARDVGEQFSSGLIKKDYVAVVRGHTDASGVIDYAMREEHDRIADALADNDKPAQAAITRYQRLADCELPFAVGRYQTARYSLVALQPETGRKHQLRRHLKHIFHHIIGDTTHGDGKHNTFFREHFDCNRLMLASTRIQLNHPGTGGALEIVAKPPLSFASVVRKLGMV